ncbi:glycosyltransferase family 39 protein [Endobacter medicaginis]|uniref:glycosyltransferase family 39 protein n=1 Tax=Endobacter medicaginis TaxID=1181271 RepID=UPI002256496A|nr:glycosyltransferase family 39 protein [Endobacter medicaginis]
MVCGLHPDFGYVDQPPGVPLLAATLYATGLGAWGLRVPVAMAAAALVWIAARLARTLGGGTWAVGLTGLACAIAPMLMGLAATLNTSVFDPLAWTAIAWLLVRGLREGDDRALVLAGVVAGVALEIKYSVAFWMAGLALGLLVTPQRILLRRRGLWIGLALAAVIALPSALWQWRHGFLFLELTAAARDKNVAVGAWSFLHNQIRVMNPLFTPLWLAGLVAPLIVRRLRDLRFIAIACVVVVVIVRAGHGKDYYLSPLYPTLFAIGAAALEPLTRPLAGRLVTCAGAALAVMLSAIAAPVALPILSPAALARYMTRLHIAPQQQERSFRGTVLPQVFADQLGWHDFTREVETAWAQIPAGDRPATGIKVDNYGEAAALDLYGHALPPALSGHNQYFLWGLRGQHPTDLLVVQHDLDALRPYCRETLVLGTTSSLWAMAVENGKIIALCRGVTPPIRTLWPHLKIYE